MTPMRCVYIFEIYSLYLLVFPAVDLDDLLVAAGITVTIGCGGRTSSDVVAPICGSGSGILWVTVLCSTCWSWVISAALTSTVVGQAAGWLSSAGQRSSCPAVCSLSSAASECTALDVACSNVSGDQIQVPSHHTCQNPCS